MIFLYEHEGETDGRRSVSNAEFFSRLCSELVRLLSAHTERGQAYRVDLRLRPEGERGPVAASLDSTLRYYETLGRTWERQALVKARPIAGDLDLGVEFLQQIEPWVYRRYLSYTEINEIKALKRRIEQKARRSGPESDVKTGRGGIRDVEFVVQFLQLLNGGGLPGVRQRNTLLALAHLQEAGCLTDQERHILEDGYRFLRKVEHRLQTMFDLQTHRLPAAEDELRKLARRMGYRDLPQQSALEQFRAAHHAKTELNRTILGHLLHGTFTDEEQWIARPEVDLILAPDPEPETIRQVLGRYPFKDVTGAYRNLLQLSEETVPFLSTPRCRHFLARIAPELLQALAATPDPDMALVNLTKVTDTLGAKGVLWELFSFNPPSLRLYVDLCAWSQYLSEILMQNPGMIDELMDSLVLNQPKTRTELAAELAELCRGAEDLDPILHSFQSSELLRIGVRDILGKDTLAETTGALSDLAEVILERVTEAEFPKMVERFGLPILAEGPRAGSESRLAILALGKFGGRELSYQSDLDVIFIYEGDGQTDARALPSRRHGRRSPPAHRPESTLNVHFYAALAQRIIKATSQLGPHGRLYQVDPRLRPTGRSGSLVLPLNEFRRYYQSGSAQLWERQALTKARVVFGPPDVAAALEQAVEEAAYGAAWQPSMADEILDMRKRLEASRGEKNLKRGFGGLVDIEFLVQLLQLKYGGTHPELRVANTLQALGALHAARIVDDRHAEELRQSYAFLRLVESRLRIVHNVSQDDLPDDPGDLDRLARRLNYEDTPSRSAVDAFLVDCALHTTRTREIFLEVLDRHRGGAARPDLLRKAAEPLGST